MFAGWVPDKAVRDTPELRRIAAMPRRLWTEESAAHLSTLYTPVLRTARGTQTLFPVQAQALNDAGIYRGLFGSILLGGGKTLLSLLLPTVLQAQRPILLVPASIAGKTKREMHAYAQHWNILVPRIRVVSYQELGRDAQKNLLINHRPDALICDEVHKLKNPKAAVTRRVTRYMGDFPDTVFCGFSGTVTKRSIKDYAHLLRWAFRGMPPVPRGWTELEEWCAALDERTNPLALILDPGALIDVLSGPQDVEPGDRTTTARRAWRRRLAETPGVVATVDGYQGSSLYIDHVYNAGKGTQETALLGYIAKARDQQLTPDDWILPDGVSIWATVRQLSLGFYYKWKTHPPEPWRILRQAWNRRVREWIKHPPRGEVFDTEFQVAQATRTGKLEDIESVHKMWREIEPTFPAERVPEWIDDGALIQCAEWLHSNKKGICWVEHRSFGHRLSRLSGLPFFANKGLDANGVEIEQAVGPIIASVGSNATGRNLQRWDRNLIVSPSPNALETEQLIGRTHRTHQESDEVGVTYLISCAEHVEAIERAQADSRYMQDTTGQAQKLLHADLQVPTVADILSIVNRRYMK